MIINVLLLIVLGELCWALWLREDRNQYQASARKLAADVVELTKEKWAAKAPAQMPLTQNPTKAQDTPKRYTGSQLRRMADSVNVAAWDGLQERPNSEVLKEQESNG